MESSRVTFNSSEPVFVVGGGPSLQFFNWKLLKGKQVVVTNDAAFFCKSASILVFLDPTFYRRRGDSLWRFEGEIVCPDDMELGDESRHGKAITRLPMSAVQATKGDYLNSYRNAGIQAINLAYNRGAREIILLGFDCNPNDRKTHFHGHSNVSPEVYLTMMQEFDEFDIALRALAAEQHEQLTIANMNSRCGHDVWPLVSFDYFNADAFDYTEVRAREQMKYFNIWGDDQYRVNCPAERVGVDQFLGWFVHDIKEFFDKGEAPTVLDAGCGTGRGALKLADNGLAVLPVDITRRCMSVEVFDYIGTAFEEVCLWDMCPKEYGSAFVFCCDVMEHIPEPLVDKVLDNLAACAGVGAYFRISLIPDGFGKKYNYVLHETVKSKEWWLEKLQARFDLCQVDDSDITSIAVAAKKRSGEQANGSTERP